MSIQDQQGYVVEMSEGDTHCSLNRRSQSQTQHDSQFQEYSVFFSLDHEPPLRHHRWEFYGYYYYYGKLLLRYYYCSSPRDRDRAISISIGTEFDWKNSVVYIRNKSMSTSCNKCDIACKLSFISLCSLFSWQQEHFLYMKFLSAADDSRETTAASHDNVAATAVLGRLRRSMMRLLFLGSHQPRKETTSYTGIRPQSIAWRIQSVFLLPRE